MAEYIDRKIAIERIQPHVKPKTMYGEGYLNAIEHATAILELIPAADVQPVNRWISVKDSVPEAGVHVLVTDGIHMMVTWCEYIDNQCLWVDNYYTYVNVRFKEVTHWMPLPDYPETIKG